MKLSISPPVFDRVPELRVVAVVASAAAAPDPQAIGRHWHEAWAGFRARGLASAIDHPHVAAYRAAMKGAGIRVGEHPPVIEALTRRVLKQPSPFSVHPIVDFYNGVCLNHVVPAAAFDLDAVGGEEITLRVAVDGDRFAPAADGAAEETMAAGELAYFAGSTALSRHFMWRQSRAALIRPSTRRFVLLSEFVPGIEPAAAAAVARALADGAGRWLGAGAVQVHWLDAQQPQALLG